MTGLDWNHNAHYHPAVLAALPSRMNRALDVGSGEGTLARELAKRSDRVLAVDRDPGMCEVARRRMPDNVTVVEGNALDLTREDGGFDGISCVASLHHLAHTVGLEAAVRHLRGLLAPGGTLVVLGLHRQPAEPLDYLQYLVARPADLAIGAFRAVVRPARSVPSGGPDMPMMDADETLPQLRAETASLLPGVRIRRLLFWRYLLVYTELVYTEPR